MPRNPHHPYAASATSCSNSGYSVGTVCYFALPFLASAAAWIALFTYHCCAIESTLLTLAINNHGYTPTKIQPVDQGLRAKGYEATDYKLIFFGDKEQVDQVLAVNPEAAILLPLKIILYREGDVVIAIAPSMEMWKGVFGGEALNLMINQWQKDVLSILQEFSRQ